MTRLRRRAGFALVLVAVAASALVGMTAAAFNGTTSEELDIASAPDWTAPTAPALAIAKSTGGEEGFIRQGGGYRVYAQVADSGNPAAGVGAVSANVASITSGQTAAALTTTGGPFTLGGVSYTHRSAALTAGGSLAAGPVAWTVAASDLASPANAMTPAGGSVTVDNTACAGSAVATANGGSVVRRPEQNDTVTFTYNDTVDPYTVLSDWSGAQTDVVVRIVQPGAAGQNDRLQVWNAANATQLPLTNATGLDLGRSDYVTATRTYGATGTKSRMTRSGAAIEIVLGTASGAGNTAGGAGTMSWPPGTGVTDRAGNACSTTVVNETGTGDAEF